MRLFGGDYEPVVVSAKQSAPAINDVVGKVTSGRSSVVDVPISGLGTTFKDGMTVLQPSYNTELIRVLEYLAKSDPEISYALDNIVQLANTEYTISFDESVPEETAIEMRAEIARMDANWYDYADGINGLRNDLLTQAAISGAVSGEYVVNNKLDGVQTTVLVSPGSIRFVHDKKNNKYIPYQLPRNSALIPGAQIVDAVTGLAGAVKLNTNTYKYIALRRIDTTPYGTPPFLPSIDPTVTRKEMMDSFKNIIKKFGIMGFLSVLIEKPKLMPGIKPEDLPGLAQKRLMEAAEEVDKGLAKGFMVGFEGSDKFEMNSTVANTDAIKDMFEINDSHKLAGVKQDGMLMGKPMSTTEAIGRVIMSKLSAQLVNYQRVTDTFLSSMFYLHLILKGFKPGYVKVESSKPTINDEAKDQQALGLKIANARSLYADGVISQTERSQMLGWEKPDQKEPRLPVIPVSPAANPSVPANNDMRPSNNGNQETDVKPVKVKQPKDQKKGRGKHSLSDEDEYGTPVYRYGLTKAQGDASAAIDEYEAEMVEAYETTTSTLADKVVAALRNVTPISGSQVYKDSVFYSLYTNFRSDFSESYGSAIDQNTKNLYRKYRTSKDDAGLPAPIYNKRDISLINYFKRSDTYYMGKLISDPDTKARISGFIDQQYLSGNLPLAGEGTAFRSAFKAMLDDESWKVRRIARTTMVQIRNTAAISMFGATGIASFKVVGTASNTQCGYCAALDGMTFSVATALDKLDTLAASDPDQVSDVAPFITQIYGKVEDIESLSAEALQQAGIDIPPFHGNCGCHVEAA